jgi:hypothetical protein
MAALPEHAVVMHPGPMNRGLEISAEVADSARSTITEQVANGVSVRMAVLYLLLGGSEPAIGTEDEAGRRPMEGPRSRLDDPRCAGARRRARDLHIATACSSTRRGAGANGASRRTA